MKFVRNAIALVGTQAVTSGLGFVYWWLAARWFAPAAVGLASAMVSTMTLLGTLGMLGLGTLLIGELPRQRRRAPQLVTTSVLVAGAASAVLGLLFALASPLISHELGSLARSPEQLVLFALGAGMTGMGLVLDQAAIGVMRGGLQFWRNTVFSVIKLAALLALGLWIGNRAGFSIFVTWIFGTAFSLGVVLVTEIAQGRFNPTYRPKLPVLQGLGRGAMQHHALNLVLMGPGQVMPLIVTAVLSARSNAFFYTAWMLNSFVMVVPVVLATVLYAAGAEDPDALHQKLRFTLAGATAYGVAAVLVVAVAGRWVLHFFGADYATEASTALTILTLSVFPLVISEHYVTLKRIERRPGAALLPLGISGLLQVVLGAIGARLGSLTGLSIGVVAGAAVVSLFLVPPVLSAVGLFHAPAFLARRLPRPTK